MKVQSLNATGKLGTATVSDAVFGVTPNQTLIAQAVRVYRANERQGTSAAQTRATIARTKRKWYKQKGTGNARHGARSAPIFVGGGAAHGPKANQNWSLKLTKQLKKAAMRSVLSAQAENIVIANDFDKLSGKTKDAAAMLTAAKLTDKRVLVVVNEMTENVVRSMRNIEDVLLVTAQQVSPLEAAMADVLVITKEAVVTLEERLATKKTAKKEAAKKPAATETEAKKATKTSKKASK
jgi:large subunit ribosomal protein L4